MTLASPVLLSASLRLLPRPLFLFCAPPRLRPVCFLVSLHGCGRAIGNGESSRLAFRHSNCFSSATRNSKPRQLKARRDVYVIIPCYSTGSEFLGNGLGDGGRAEVERSPDELIVVGEALRVYLLALEEIQVPIWLSHGKFIHYGLFEKFSDPIETIVDSVASLLGSAAG